MALLGKIRTRSGLRFTSPADSLSIDVEAFASPGDSVARVEITVSGPGGPSQIFQVPSHSLRFPNYSSDSPLPGVLPGKMAYLYCYGYTLNADEWAGGWIRIQAHIIPTVGLRKSLGVLWVLNDSDGADRRGSSTTIYANAQTGNDANSGGLGSPVATLQRAVDLARKNRTGSSSSTVDMNAGGALIIAEGNFTGVRTSGSFYWHTDREWLTIQAGPAGASYAGYADFRDWFGGNGVLSAPTTASIRVIGFTMTGTMQLDPSNNANCTMSLWLDRCTMHNPHWTQLKRWSVRFRESPQLFGWCIPKPGNTRGDVFASCCHIIGNDSGPNNFTDSQDVRVTDWTASGLYCNGTVPNASAVNCLFEGQRYNTNDVEGYIRATGNGNLLVSVPSADVLRIETTGPIYNTGGDEAELATLEEIANNSYWQVDLTGFGANTGRWPVLSAGEGFVELSVPGAVVEQPAPTAVIWTWGTTLIYGSGGMELSYNALVHPDLMWLGTLTGSVFSNIAARDIRNAQTLFGNSNPKSECVFFNISDGGFAGAFNFAGAPMDKCIVSQCSFTGSASFHPNTTNCLINNNVWLSASNLPVSGSNGNLLSSNHSINGPAQGPTGSSGPFYLYDPSQPPYSYQPIQAYVTAGGAHTLLQAQTDHWWWPGADNAPIGSLTNSSLQTWQRLANLISGSAAGSSGASLSFGIIAALSATAAGTSSAALNLTEKQALFGIAQGTSTASLDLGVQTTTSLQGSAGGTSNAAGSLTLLRQLQGTAAGSSSAAGNLYTPEAVYLSGSAAGGSLALASITLFLSPGTETDPQLPDSMKQRIHNALHALVATGAFYPCKVNPKNGQMTVDTSAVIKPTSIIIKEVRASFRPAQRLRTSFNVSELQSWTWMARVQFNTEVACEVFEENAIAAGIKIPPIIGVDTQRTLLARLADSDYSHGPAQSPSTGTVVDFVFEVIPETLRK